MVFFGFNNKKKRTLATLEDYSGWTFSHNETCVEEYLASLIDNPSKINKEIIILIRKFNPDKNLDRWILMKERLVSKIKAKLNKKITRREFLKGAVKTTGKVAEVAILGSALYQFLQVLKPKEAYAADLPENILSKIVFRHKNNICVLYNDPFIRIVSENEEAELKKGNGYIKIVRKSVLDQEDNYEHIICSVLMKYFEAYMIKSDYPLPHPSVDQHPILKYLRENNKIKIEFIDQKDIETAEKIFSIKPKLSRLPVRNMEVSLQVPQAQYYIADLKKTRFISTLGLGPCVAFILYDKFEKKGAIAHIDPCQNILNILNSISKEFNQSYDISAYIVGGWSGYSERIIFYLREYLSNTKTKIIFQDILGSDIKRKVTLDLNDGSIFSN